jgi:hypothetical protein
VAPAIVKVVAMASVIVPGFSPSSNGLHFRNAFPPAPIRQFRLGNVATLNIGDAANGLCGGMSFTVRDLFERGLTPPPDRTPPASGNPRFDYIVNRQIDSFDDGRLPLRFYRLMSPSRPAAEPFWARWLGQVGIDRHSRAYVMLHDEWPRIRADLDAGTLSMIGLVRVVDRDPLQLGRNHQVVAYGYDLEGTRLTLRIYDPNYPDDDGLTLGIDTANPLGTAGPNYSTNDPPLVCFFRAPYIPRDPLPFR